MAKGPVAGRNVRPATPLSDPAEQGVNVAPAPTAPVGIGDTGFRRRNRQRLPPGFTSRAGHACCATCGFSLLPTETEPCHRCREGGWARAQQDWEHAQEAWDHAMEDRAAADSEYAAARQTRDTAETAWNCARDMWWQAEMEWADAERTATDAEGTVQQREVEWEQAQTAWLEAREAAAERERQSLKLISNRGGEDPE